MNNSKRWDQYWDENPHNRWLEPDQKIVDLTHELKSLHPSMHQVLDLGAGLGRHTIFFSRQGYQTHGADTSMDATSLCRQWHEREDLPASLLLSDMTALPYRDSTFDFVLCYYVIHHGHLNTMASTFREVCRVLAPGGFFYSNFWSSDAADKMKGDQIEPGTFVFNEGDEIGIPHHFTSPEELEAFVDGFEVIRKERDRHWQLLLRKP